MPGPHDDRDSDPRPTAAAGQWCGHSDGATDPVAGPATVMDCHHDGEAAARAAERPPAICSEVQVQTVSLGLMPVGLRFGLGGLVRLLSVLGSPPGAAAAGPLPPAGARGGPTAARRADLKMEGLREILVAYGFNGKDMKETAEEEVRLKDFSEESRILVTLTLDIPL